MDSRYNCSCYCFPGCKKKTPDYLSPYAANIGKARLWSGLYNSNTHARQISDTSIPVVVNGNDITFFASTLLFKEKNETSKTITFTNANAPASESKIRMIYYYEGDSMVYDNSLIHNSADWSYWYLSAH